MKKLGKHLLRLLSILLLLVVLLVISLRLPVVQNFVKNQLVHYLGNQLDTEVSLDYVFVNFPSKITIDQLYLADQKSDTLLYANHAEIGVHLWDLLEKKATITSISLEGIRANVSKDSQGGFNFDYIIQAFATESDTKEVKESKPFTISLGDISLEDVHLNYSDHQSGDDIDLVFDRLNTYVNTFDLQKNIYELSTIQADGLRTNIDREMAAAITQSIVDADDDVPSNSPPLQVKIDGVELTNFDVLFNDEQSKIFAKVKFNELNAEINHMDLAKNYYSVASVLLDQADIVLRISNKTSASQTEQIESESSASIPLSALLEKVDFKNVHLTYDNISETRKLFGLDPNHLQITNFNGGLESIAVEQDSYKGVVKHLSFEERSGLEIQKFSSSFSLDKQEANLTDLYLKTAHSLFRTSLALTYENLDQIGDNLGGVGMNAHLSQSKISFQEILLFVPQMKENPIFSKYQNETLEIDAQVEGTVDHFFLKNFNIQGLGDTRLAVSGQIQNALDLEKLNYDIQLSELAVQATTLKSVLPDSLLPPSIHLPDQMALSGQLAGGIDKILTEFSLATTLGNVMGNAKVDISQKGNETYDIKADIIKLDVGSLLQDSTLALFSGKIDAKGQGFELQKAATDVELVIDEFGFKDHVYHAIDLSGHLENNTYKVAVKSDDQNLDLQVNAHGSVSDDKISLKLAGLIEDIDLFALNFMDSPFNISGKLDGDFSNLFLNDLNGDFLLTDLQLEDQERAYDVGNIQFGAISKSDSMNIELSTKFLNIELGGEYDILQLASSLEHSINQYYQISEPDSIPQTTHQSFHLKGVLRDDPILHDFIPGLDTFDDITLSGTYESDNPVIDIIADIPKITLDKSTLDNGLFTLNNKDGALKYALTLDDVIDDRLSLHKLDLQGSIENNQIDLHLQTRKPETDSIEYELSGALQLHQKVLTAKIGQDIVLNSQIWGVNPQNRVVLSPNGLIIDQFILHHKQSMLGAQSDSNSPNSPILLTINNFNIQTITNLLSKDDDLISGVINGTAHISNPVSGLQLESDITINDIEILQNAVGNAHANIHSKSAGVYALDIGLEGYGNDFKLMGDYALKTNVLDLDLHLDSLQMKTIESFAGGLLSESTGALEGLVSIGGTAQSPELTGDINFHEVNLFLPLLGSHFKNVNDAIIFDNEGVRFSSFKFNDTRGSELLIDGQILTEDYRDFAFDLSINAKDFRIVDTDDTGSNLIHGILAVDTHFKISGDLNLPVVDGTVEVTDETDFTFVLPQSTTELQSREGLVEFVDFDEDSVVVTIDTLSTDSLTISDITGLDVSVNIEIDPEAKTKIVIDRNNGDYLEIQGEAELTGGIDPSGKTSLVGTYEVSEGAYELSLTFVKRKFDIQDGSFISWQGGPLEAEANITAIYKIETPPADLLSQQISNLSGSQLNQYKQDMPFDVELIMSGELLEPEISFNIETDSDNTNVATQVKNDVDAKLYELKQDPSEMNKQVVALLVLNRFISDNAFVSAVNSSTEGMARESVSAIITDQLNNLAGDLISGVDIDFDLQSGEDYSTGEAITRTDLDVNISKQLLNDRLTIKVGSNFGLEGTRTNEQANNIAGDISVEYALSEDRQYILKAYQKNEYEVALQGQIIESGVAFLITVDYDKFKELFRKKSKTKNSDK